AADYAGRTRSSSKPSFCHFLTTRYWPENILRRIASDKLALQKTTRLRRVDASLSAHCALEGLFRGSRARESGTRGCIFDERSKSAYPWICCRCFGTYGDKRLGGKKERDWATAKTRRAGPAWACSKDLQPQLRLHLAERFDGRFEIG